MGLHLPLPLLQARRLGSDLRGGLPPPPKAGHTTAKPNHCLDQALPFSFTAASRARVLRRVLFGEPWFAEKGPALPNCRKRPKPFAVVRHGPRVRAYMLRNTPADTPSAARAPPNTCPLVGAVLDSTASPSAFMLSVAAAIAGVLLLSRAYDLAAALHAASNALAGSLIPLAQATYSAATSIESIS